MVNFSCVLFPSCFALGSAVLVRLLAVGLDRGPASGSIEGRGK